LSEPLVVEWGIRRVHRSKNPEKSIDGSPLMEVEITQCLRHKETGNPQLFFHLSADPRKKEYNIRLPVEFKETGLVIEVLLLKKPDRKVRANFLQMEYHHDGFAVPDLHSGSTNQIPLVVLEPHWLINVTTLTNFDFCQRNYFLERYMLKRQNKAMMRGTFVHEVFDHIIQCTNDVPGLLQECSASLMEHALDLAFLGVSPSELYDDAKNHLNGLFKGLKRQNVLEMDQIEEIYPERYIINPHIGLKGRIDLIVKHKDGRKQAIELKTSKPWGKNAQPGHTLQVHAYHLLMMEKGEERLAPPMVIYSGEAAKKLFNGERIPSHFWNHLFREAPFTKSDAINMMNKRNVIVSADYLMNLGFTKNPNKCGGCAKIGKGIHCSFLHDLGLKGGQEKPMVLSTPLNGEMPAPDERVVQWFARYNQAVAEEFSTVKEESGRTLSHPVEDRLKSGFCLRVQANTEMVKMGILRLESIGKNESEFREGDPCLLSDKRGPVQGECLEVHITNVDNQEISVQTPRGIGSLWFEPYFLDRHTSESHFEKNFASLYALLNSESEVNENLLFLRDFLIHGKNVVLPNKLGDSAFLPDKPAFPLHSAQEKAVRHACGLEKLLLIQGPPGTGKTCTVAHIIQALHQQGKRILVGTFTHRASDELMKKLTEFAGDVPFTKLGRIESITEDFKSFALAGQLSGKEKDHGTCSEKDKVFSHAEAQYQKASDLIGKYKVFIATTHAWMSGKYDALASPEEEKGLFDVAIIDEASQVILPQMIGTLRLAKRWILVGDHKQLPPVIQSEKAALLKKTLFEQLFENLPDDPSVKIRLEEQHRMPAVLAHFISNRFYGGRLQTQQEDQQLSVVLDGKFKDILDGKKRIMLLHIPSSHNANRSYRQSPSEAELIRKMVEEYDRAGFDFRSNGNSRIGIIAPYRAQVSAIRRELEQAFGDPKLARQMVDTVDRFQGDERDVIFLSTCMHPHEKETPILYRDIRRINVALSRAKAKLVVVGDMNLLKNIEVFRDLILYVQDHPEQCGYADMNKQELHNLKP